MTQAAVQCEKVLSGICEEMEGDEGGDFSDQIGYEDTEGITPLMTSESEELEKKEFWARNLLGETKLAAMPSIEALDIVSEHLTTNKAQLFLTQRRPEKREMSDAP